MAEPAEDRARADALIANLRTAMTVQELVDLGKTIKSYPEFRARTGNRRAEMISTYNARKAELDHENEERAAIAESSPSPAVVHPAVAAESEACLKECE